MPLNAARNLHSLSLKQSWRAWFNVAYTYIFEIVMQIWLSETVKWIEIFVSYKIWPIQYKQYKSNNLSPSISLDIIKLKIYHDQIMSWTLRVLTSTAQLSDWAFNKNLLPSLHPKHSVRLLTSINFEMNLVKSCRYILRMRVRLWFVFLKKWMTKTKGKLQKFKQKFRKNSWSSWL